MKIWDKIAAQINASNNNAVRTGEEAKKNLASSIKMKNAKGKLSRRMTGGGVGMPEATDTELKVWGIITTIQSLARSGIKWYPQGLLLFVLKIV